MGNSCHNWGGFSCGKLTWARITSSLGGIFTRHTFPAKRRIESIQGPSFPGENSELVKVRPQASNRADLDYLAVCPAPPPSGLSGGSWDRATSCRPPLDTAAEGPLPLGPRSPAHTESPVHRNHIRHFDDKDTNVIKSF